MRTKRTLLPFLNNWKILYKILVPLHAVVILSGFIFISAFVYIYGEIMNDAFPEERALSSIKSAAATLVGEYREYMLTPESSTLEEIAELKAEIEEQEAQFARSALFEDHEAEFVGEIEAGEQQLKSIGDRAVTLRDQIEERNRRLEDIENAIDAQLDVLQGVAARQSESLVRTDPQSETLEASLAHLLAVVKLAENIHEYLGEIREYILQPEEDTLEELAEIEARFETRVRANHDDMAQRDDEQRILDDISNSIEALKREAGAAVQTGALLEDSLEALEDAENRLEGVLRKAEAVVTEETDRALRSGGAILAGSIVAALLATLFIGWRVTLGVTGPLDRLSAATSRFGAGDLSQRSGLKRGDEIGALARSFDEMAEGLERNIRRREGAEAEARQLNVELEERVQARTAELRAAQEELLGKERLSAIGQLTATVSHELRNPLGTIRTSLFSVNEKTRDKGLDVERSLDRMLRGIERCNRIVGDLLDYTRTPTLKLKATAIDDWLDRVLREEKPIDGIVLERTLTSGAMVALDRERFRRVVINLLTNASQAMIEQPGKHRRLRVETSARNGHAEIRFTDSGPGIPDEALPRIFEPLYSTKSFGVGLGLPTVKQIVEQHGGAVAVESAKPEGARILVRLPLAPEQEVNPA